MKEELELVVSILCYYWFCMFDGCLLMFLVMMVFVVWWIVFRELKWVVWVGILIVVMLVGIDVSKRVLLLVENLFLLVD